jgi:ABC-type amino acid transport substrate-binding protein
LVLFLAFPALVAAQQYNLGFAAGYPPYQFLDNGKPAGLDIEIAGALGKYGLNAKISQENWDDVVGKLRNRLGIDIVGGMEISDERRAQFDFTTPLYTRKNAVFVLASNGDIKKLEDLQGRIVSGDRGGFVENQLEKLGIKTKVRLVEYASKEESLQALKDGKIVASIMPDAVGFYLARQLGVAVRLIDVGDPGSPVAFAVRKGDAAGLAAVGAAVQKALAAKALDPIIAKWLK